MSSTRFHRVVVGCAANAAFAKALAVMVRSLLENLAIGRELDLWIVDSGLGADNRMKLLRSWEDGRLTVHWLDPDFDRLAGLPLWGRMRAETYLRVMMTKLLPDSLERVIWLDADLVVLGDVCELWEADMGGVGLLAAQDLVVPYVSSRYGISAHRELGMEADAAYFNAGVMVVDLEWWRRHEVTARALDHLRRHRGSVWFWDQEGLNVALAGRWRALDPCWNQIAGVCGRSFLRVPHLDQMTYRRVTTDPLAVHFAGSVKPWHCRCAGSYGDSFFHYLDETAWAGWRPRLTPRAILLGLITSRLRPVLYPLELPLLKLQRALRR